MARQLRAAASAAMVIGARQQQLWGIGAAASRRYSSQALYPGSVASEQLGSALIGAGLRDGMAWSRPVAQQGRPLGLAGIMRAQPLAAVLIDAAGTLLYPAEDVAIVYQRYAARYGAHLPQQQILERFRRAYNQPYTESTIRYVGDGRPFWSTIVAQSTGCSDPRLCEEIYKYYEQPGAWKLAHGAVPALLALRAAGLQLAVVSNFDTRLRTILRSLGVLHLFDAIIVSADVGAEKPNPVIFEAALQSLNVPAEATVHVGDDRRNDLWGARDAGITGWLWGSDVKSFEQLARCALQGGIIDQDDSDEDEMEQLQA